MVNRGEAVEFLTWTCSGNTSQLQSAVWRGDGERWTSKPVEIRESGVCIELSDIVDTDRLPPGRYAYEVSMGGEAPETATAAFAVMVSPDVGPDDTQPAASRRGSP